MMKRRGFTLIELMVAMAILLVLTSMAFRSFSIASALSTSNQNREAVLEDMTTVLDQLTKELRQTVTMNQKVTSTGITSSQGVDLPVPNSVGRGLTAILNGYSPQPGHVQTGQHYLFGSADDTAASDSRTILRFYTQGDDGGVYRISYTLGVPFGGGISQAYWPDRSYQPCEVWYTREKWTDAGGKDGVIDVPGELSPVVSSQPVTGQVITNFTVIRPSWSGKVVQIVLEAMVKNGTGSGSTTITRIAQISLRQ
jgi:prepilin-type N-terminal cleavage/methylation domain-containing protein